MRNVCHREIASCRWLVVGCTQRSLVPSISAFGVDVFDLRHQVVLGQGQEVMGMRLKAKQLSMDSFQAHSRDIPDRVLAFCHLRHFGVLVAVLLRLL